jgi:hypothetical protein
MNGYRELRAWLGDQTAEQVVLGILDVEGMEDFNHMHGHAKGDELHDQAVEGSQDVPGEGTHPGDECARSHYSRQHSLHHRH